MNTTSLALFAASLGLTPLAAADNIRWIGPSNGLYTDPANWDLNRVPTAGDHVILDLPGTYTVSVPAGAHSLGALTVLNGSVVLAGPGAVQVAPFTPRGDPVAQVRIGDGVNPACLTILDVQFSTALPGLALLVQPQGTLVTDGAGSVYVNNLAEVQDGGFVRVKGGFISPGHLTLRTGSTAVVTGGLLNGAVLMLEPGVTTFVTGPQARLTCEDFMELGGDVTVTGGGRIEPLAPSNIADFSLASCDLTIADGGSAFLNSVEMDAESRVEVGHAGVWRDPSGFAEHHGTFIALPGADVELSGAYTGPLEVDHQSTIRRSTSLALLSGLTVTLDGLVDLPGPIIPLASDEGGTTTISGPLTVRVRHENAFHAGEVIPIFAHEPGSPEEFTGLVYNELGGGRELQLVREGAPAVSSVAVTMGMPSCYLNADFDGDGDAGSDADLEAFFACLAGSCCDTCATTDFNGDGDAATDADIEAFFTVLAGGSC